MCGEFRSQFSPAFGPLHMMPPLIFPVNQDIAHLEILDEHDGGRITQNVLQALFAVTKAHLSRVHCLKCRSVSVRDLDPWDSVYSVASLTAVPRTCNDTLVCIR